MKRFILSLIFVLPCLIGLNSCSSDDEDVDYVTVDSMREDIIGNWLIDNECVYVFEKSGMIKKYSSELSFLRDQLPYSYGSWNIEGTETLNLNISWIGFNDNNSDETPSPFNEVLKWSSLYKDPSSGKIISIIFVNENGKRITFNAINKVDPEDYIKNYLIGSWSWGLTFNSDGSYFQDSKNSQIHQLGKYFGTWSVDVDVSYINLLEMGYYDEHGNKVYYTSPKLLTYEYGIVDDNEMVIIFTDNSRPEPSLDQGGGIDFVFFYTSRLSH